MIIVAYLNLLLLFTYLSVFSFILGLIPVQWEKRPVLLGIESQVPKKKLTPLGVIIEFIRKIAIINKPLCIGEIRKRLLKDLAMAHVPITPEEFFLIKEICIAGCLYILFLMASPETMMFSICIGIAAGYMLPEFWLKGRIRKVKDVIVKELPDAIDLLGLCVNAGLDFMLSLKWVVEKSPKSVMVEELNNLLQEISVGKTRRDAIKDLALKYELPDLSTFARTLIQADKMGTSMTEALNILSEDMRLARYRRGEQMALKAPLKMLIPLLLFIFPVVGVLVAGPILLDFIENNPFKSMAGG